MTSKNPELTRFFIIKRRHQVDKKTDLGGKIRSGSLGHMRKKAYYTETSSERL